MGDTKGKRGRQPKNLSSASDQTVENVDASSYQPGLRRCRQKKISRGSDGVDWESIANAVVKVFCVHKEPNYLLPWHYTEDNSSSSGFVISGKRVLTTAHSVKHYTETDAAINFGNSGGPACNSKGNCVGIAFKSQEQGDDNKIGYVIPTPIITHFIQDYEKNGKYTGFPVLGVKWQAMENPFMRMAMGMKTDQTGVRVRKIDPTAPASEVLKESDIILSFDGFDIGNDGKVSFCHGERIRFSHFVSQKYDGDVVAMKVIRNSQIRHLNIKLESGGRLIPAYVTGEPSYYIVAGFVFTILSAHYLDSKYGKDYENKTRLKLLDKLLQRPYDEQVVVVSQVLPVDSNSVYKGINSGYEDIIGNTQVVALNGKKVKNLKSIVTMVESCDEEFLKFELELHQLVLLETESAKEATLSILATYGILSDMSDDLKREDGMNHHLVS